MKSTTHSTHFTLQDTQRRIHHEWRVRTRRRQTATETHMQRHSSVCRPDASASPHRLSYPGSERGRQHGKQKRVTGLLAAKETERYDFHYSSLQTATLKRSADFIWLFSASERRCREIHTDHKRATNEKIIKRCIVGKKWLCSCCLQQMTDASMF